MTSSIRAGDLGLYRNYLMLIAKPLWPKRLQAKDGLSDLVQETLLDAYRHFGTFQGSAPAELLAWLRAVLARNIMDKMRELYRLKRDVRRERSIEASLEESSERLRECLAASQSSPSKWAIREEELVRLADALGQLPDDQREAVTLHHLHRLSISESAQQMGKTAPAAAGLLRRGMAALRKQLDDQG